MKTIREHFETLPEPFRTQAIVKTPMSRLKQERETPADALIDAFHWGKGEDYSRWFKLWRKLKKK